MSNRVSESEQIVMEVLWQESPLTSLEVVERLAGQGWNEKTVKTFLNRMVKKGVLSYETVGRKYLYSPAIKHEDFIKQESDGFIEKMFKGDVKQLLTAFVVNKNVSKEELSYLRDLLDKEGESND